MATQQHIHGSNYCPELSEAIHESAIQDLQKMKTEWSSDWQTHLAWLPFIKGHGDQRFWSVKSSGNSCIDSEMGTVYAYLYLQFVALGGDLNLFWVMKSMALTDKSAQGIAIGFLGVLKRYLSGASTHFPLKENFDRDMKSHRTVHLMSHLGKSGPEITQFIAETKRGKL